MQITWFVFIVHISWRFEFKNVDIVNDVVMHSVVWITLCLIPNSLSSPQENSILKPWSSYINPLWPSDVIWQHRSQSTLAQVMASQYFSLVNVCCIHLGAISLPVATILHKVFDKSPRGQWVKQEIVCGNIYLPSLLFPYYRILPLARDMIPQMLSQELHIILRWLGTFSIEYWSMLSES